MPVDVAPNPLPKYQQLSRYLHEQISTGRLRPGSRIPGDHEMATQFGVSRVTVRQAIGQLAKSGYVSREPGRGTFVNAPQERQDKANGSRVLHMALLYADAFLNRDYPMWQARAVEQLLLQHNSVFSMASFDSSVLAEGKLPLLLSQGMAQGVLIDGQVYDFHCAALEKLGLPYVVLGNHAIEQRRPQVLWDFAEITKQAVARAAALRPTAPVVLIVEPFRLHYTRDVYAAYEAAVAELPQKFPILQLCSEDAAEKAIDALLARGIHDFSIVTGDRTVARILLRYSERGLTPDERPIVAIGSGRRLSPRTAAQVHQMILPIESLAERAVNALIESVRYGRNEVYIKCNEFKYQGTNSCSS